MLESQVCLVILLEVVAFFFFLHKSHICSPPKPPRSHLVSPESTAVSTGSPEPTPCLPLSICENFGTCLSLSTVSGATSTCEIGTGSLLSVSVGGGS